VPLSCVSGFPVETYVNRFISEASTGGNEWRYCILEPKIPPPQVAPLTEEEEAAAEAAEIARMMKDLEMAQQAAIAREELAAERRELHDLEGGILLRGCCRCHAHGPETR